jgi:hypothetical protein
MLTKQDLKIKYGDDIVFLFKGDEPFTEINNHPAGMLIERDGKVMCYECGKWFKSLGRHISTHRMKLDEYKEKYGFNKNCGLCSKEVSFNASERFTDMHKKGIIKPPTGELLCKAREKANLARIGTKTTMQYKNQHDTCPEQLRKRMELLVSKFGETVTVKEARTFDYGLVTRAKEYEGGWNKFKESFGIKINEINKKTKDIADLIYDIRRFVISSNRLPWYGKKQVVLDGFPHIKGTYKNYFGSYRKAWLHCGLKRESRNFWLTVD